MNSGILKSSQNTRRGRGRPKFTWEEGTKKRLKDWIIPRDLALDRTAWKSASHVPKSRFIFFTCTSSLLFWVLTFVC